MFIKKAAFYVAINGVNYIKTKAQPGAAPDREQLCGLIGKLRWRDW